MRLLPWPLTDEILIGAADAITVPPLVATQRVTLVGARCLLVGWAMLNGATANTIKLEDGLTANASLLAPFQMAANGASLQWFGTGGINVNVGLSIVATKATLASTVWAIPLVK